jgi:hypothetical protein
MKELMATFPGNSDDDAVEAWVANCDSIPAGTYNLTRQLRIEGNCSLCLVGDATLDSAGATDKSLFPDPDAFLMVVMEMVRKVHLLWEQRVASPNPAAPTKNQGLT